MSKTNKNAAKRSAPDVQTRNSILAVAFTANDLAKAGLRRAERNQEGKALDRQGVDAANSSQTRESETKF